MSYREYKGDEVEECGKEDKPMGIKRREEVKEHNQGIRPG
jgi:hypothetical protein